MAQGDEYDRWRDLLNRELSEIDAADRSGAEGQVTVTLDQQSVGRLSRMDALAQQAMAQANARRRAARRTRIARALERMEEGEFGFCQVCGEEIPALRLNLDPAAATCVGCSSG